MKIVIAPDSFKGSLTALEVAERIQIGFQRLSDAHFTVFRFQMAVKAL